MKIAHTALFSALLLAGSVHVYDTKAYCKTASESVGGSYVIEEECRKQENVARASLMKTRPPTRIDKYCEEVGSVVGDSYASRTNARDRNFSLGEGGSSFALSLEPRIHNDSMNIQPPDKSWYWSGANRKPS